MLLFRALLLIGRIAQQVAEPLIVADLHLHEPALAIRIGLEHDRAVRVLDLILVERPLPTPGTNNPSAASRPFGVAFTPDGKTLLVSNFRANNLSFVDVERALSGGLGAETARLPLATPDGKPSRPRGIAITPDGKYAAVTGAPRGEPNSGVLWVIDIAQRKAVGRVTGVGNETYLLALLP